MDIDKKIERRLKKDGLTIEDLTPEQLEHVREEFKERMRLGPDGMMIDGFFSSMDYIGLVFRKRCDPNYKHAGKQEK